MIQTLYAHMNNKKNVLAHAQYTVAQWSKPDVAPCILSLLSGTQDLVGRLTSAQAFAEESQGNLKARGI
jgi:hypothetical protein